MVELASSPDSTIKKVALVCDVRGGQYFSQLEEALKSLEEHEVAYQILFLEAADDALVNRYKETRRRHPLADEGQITEGIQRERELLEGLRGRADLVIDTTGLKGQALREKIKESFLSRGAEGRLLITVVSFGFKHGIPLDADCVIDVRFIPNPYYEEDLKNLTGLDKEVQDYVLSRGEAQKFLLKFNEMLGFLMPLYVKEGKTHFVLAIGCTGGNHRSVVLAEKIHKFLIENKYDAVLKHRELEHG